MSVADAVMQLASGTVELALEDPEFARWCWFADVLDPDRGLTGRLPSAGDDVLHELKRVAGMCRTSGKEELNPEVWRAANVAPRDQPKDRPYPVWRPRIWRFRRPNDIALECIDEPHPEFTVAIALAFESLAACAADSAAPRCWIARALIEWTNRTHPVAGDLSGRGLPVTDQRSNQHVDSLRRLWREGLVESERLGLKEHWHPRSSRLAWTGDTHLTLGSATCQQ
jgi:hypothetical protein